MNKTLIRNAVEQMGALRFFPSEPGARTAIMALLERMVRTPDQLAWLVRTMIDRVGEWHGTAELRGVYCTRFSPADGEDVSCSVTPGFTPEALEGRSAEEHYTSKFLGAGASVALLPDAAAKWETLPPADAPEAKPDGKKPVAKREKITTRSEKQINDLLRKMGAA